MHFTPSSRGPHEPYVREVLAQMHGLRDRPGSGVRRDHQAEPAEHRFALPTIKPVGGAPAPDSPDW